MGLANLLQPITGQGSRHRDPVLLCLWESAPATPEIWEEGLGFHLQQ